MVNNGLRIQKAKNSKPTVIFILIAVLLAVAIAAGAYWFWQRSTSQQNSQNAPGENQVNYDYNDPSSEAEREQPIPAKQQPQEEPEPPSGLNVVVTHAGQNENKVSIRALVEGATTGTCTLTLSKSGQPDIVKTAPMAVQATYTICQGFDIPTAEFGAGGEWTASVKAEDGARGGTAQATLEVQK